MNASPPLLRPEDTSAILASFPHQLYIGGRWRENSGAQRIEVIDPSTEAVIATVPDASPQDAQEAVKAAALAAPGWRTMAPRARSEILRRCFELMIERSEMLAVLIALENGKALRDARGEVAYAAEFFRWNAEEAVRIGGEFCTAPSGTNRIIVDYAPIGICVLITPWNFPAAMATRKIAPALAAGCTVVLKPAAETPLTALAIVDLLARAGVPAGVVSVVPTTAAAEVVSTWLADDRVRKVSFTGSTGVGKVLLKQAAERVLNSSMELGGNAPFVVTADADVEAAVAGALIAKFRNAGQACTAANRFFVHEDIVEEFVARVGEVVESLEVAPLISAKAVAGVTALVDEAVDAGARVTHLGSTGKGGWFYPATLLVDVYPSMRIAREEIFGPVVSVITWRDEETMLAQANDTEFGLAAYVFAGRLQDALRIAEALDAGMVGVNRGVVSDPSTPFGGVKQSGIGREGARDGIREYQETQYFSVDWS
jgi:succinate-semialdehyde dehydrogenase/glutarate-semialdehyde dehydrogenase